MQCVSLCYGEMFGNSTTSCLARELKDDEVAVILANAQSYEVIANLGVASVIVIRGIDEDRDREGVIISTINKCLLMYKDDQV